MVVLSKAGLRQTTAFMPKQEALVRISTEHVLVPSNSYLNWGWVWAREGQTHEGNWGCGGCAARMANCSSIMLAQ
eukprot:859761-Rhodomonas_salina.1